MDWEKQSLNWPNRTFSRHVDSRPHRWHVQDMGDGPLLLLIHGAGGATQSWRDLMPVLAATHRVVAIDLPGQGFTQLGNRTRCGLNHMAEDILSLSRAEGWEPAALIGHSAGGALALRLFELGLSPQGRCIGINAALGNFEGLAGLLFPMMAKLLALNPLTATVFSKVASSEQSVRRLINSTGSTLSDEGLGYYRRLVSSRNHVDATLAMMAQWKLDGLMQRLPGIETKTLFIVASNDKTVPPKTSVDAAALMPNAQVAEMTGLGHLAHEEDPAQTAAIIRDFLDN